MTEAAQVQRFVDRDALASALADRIADALRARLQQEPEAWLAVSGGTTPQRMFDQLSNAQLDWTRVVVTLVDERCVGEDSPRSNAALVRQHLLKGPADFARFVPLYQAGQTPQQARAQTQRVLSTAPASFAAVALGMGLDGHTASFFPGGDRLAQAIDPDTQDRVETMQAPAAGEPRVTLTLPTLLQADLLVLQIEGDDKLKTFSAALEPGPAEEMPVRAVLGSPQRRLVVYWAP